MGDPSGEVTEESRDASQEAKGLAMEAMSEGSALLLFPSAGAGLNCNASHNSV
jgi:hypothetical protein